MNKTKLIKEFERPKVVHLTAEEIEIARDMYHSIVASFTLENSAPTDFHNVVMMEQIRGELTKQQAREIGLHKNQAEVKRINEKLNRLAKLGLSWRDL